jgi:hypothetical protein
MDELPFCPTAPQNLCRTPSLPPSRNTIGTLLCWVFKFRVGPNFILIMHSQTNQAAVVQVMNIRLEQATNMVNLNYRVHIEPFSNSQGVAQCCQPTHYPLHIQGPSQCPRIDKPYPASVSATRPAVAGCTRKDVVQVMLFGSSIPDWYHRKLSQDTLNGDDIENWSPVVELIYNSRADGLQPTRNRTMDIIAFKCIIILNKYNCYNSQNYIITYNWYNAYNYHSQDRHMIPTLTREHNWRTWTQSQQTQRTGVKPEHTRQYLATQRKHNHWYPAVELWRGPGDDCHKKVSLETRNSKPAELLFSWCDLAPNNWTVQNGPCVWLILVFPMLQELKNNVYN